MASFTIIEPMSTGDVIDRAVRLYRRNFGALVSIIAVPVLIGYVTSMMFWFGYTKVLTASASDSPGQFPAEAFLLMGLGGIGYPVWLFIFLATIAGLSRVVGDNVMLGEAISFRKCLSAVRHRLGDILLMGLLSIAILFVLYIVFAVIMFVVVIAAALLAGMTAAAGLPPWLVTTILVIVILAALAAGIISILVVLARVIFLPQVVMIEGQSAGSAVGRAMQLGKGNWYKFGAIALFIYFISLSIVAALRLPVMLGLYWMGASVEDLFFNPVWTAFYAGLDQISNLLATPIFVVAVTLLYFDSRVRKEAYDIELLAREISPGFYWQPTVASAAFGYQMPVASAYNRPYVQTSPLGLAGYYPPAAPPDTSPLSQASVTQPAFDTHPVYETQPVIEPADPSQETTGEQAVAACEACGAALHPGARFCIKCGSPAEAASRFEDGSIEQKSQS